MDIFDVHERVVGDYLDYTTSFVSPLEPRLADFVEARVERGEQWPEPGSRLIWRSRPAS